MPNIPIVDFTDKKSKRFDIADNIYKTMVLFMPKMSVESLESHYLDNKKAVETMRRMNPGLYEQLIEEFKARKKEILEGNQGNTAPSETADH
jgi:hypothetical protein